MFHPFLTHWKITIFIIIIITILVGCTAEKDAWRDATDLDTIESYEKYLKEYPKGKYVEEAIDKIEKIEWAIADKKGSLEGYLNYLQNYPEGKYVTNAKVSMDRVAWRDAENNNTIESYETYLDFNPEGKYTIQAKNKLDELSWIDAKNNNTIISYKNYLSCFPSGSYAREAFDNILGLHASAVLKGEGNDEAAMFNRNEPGPHKVLIINKDGILQREWNLRLPHNWIANCISDTRLIVIMQDEWKTIEKCDYSYGRDASHVYRRQHLIDIEIREAKTGRLLDKTSLKGGMPDKCPMTMEFTTHSTDELKITPSRRINGDPIPEGTIKVWLARVVDP